MRQNGKKNIVFFQFLQQIGGICVILYKYLFFDSNLQTVRKLE